MGVLGVLGVSASAAASNASHPKCDNVSVVHLDLLSTGLTKDLYIEIAQSGSVLDMEALLSAGYTLLLNGKRNNIFLTCVEPSIGPFRLRILKAAARMRRCDMCAYLANLHALASDTSLGESDARRYKFMFEKEEIHSTGSDSQFYALTGIISYTFEDIMVALVECGSVDLVKRYLSSESVVAELQIDDLVSRTKHIGSMLLRIAVSNDNADMCRYLCHGVMCDITRQGAQPAGIVPDARVAVNAYMLSASCAQEVYERFRAEHVRDDRALKMYDIYKLCIDFQLGKFVGQVSPRVISACTETLQATATMKKHAGIRVSPSRQKQIEQQIRSKQSPLHPVEVPRPQQTPETSIISILFASVIASREPLTRCVEILLTITCMLCPSLVGAVQVLIMSKDDVKHTSAVKALARVHADVLNFGIMLSAAICSASPCWKYKVQWVCALFDIIFTDRSEAAARAAGTTTGEGDRLWSQNDKTQVFEAVRMCGSYLTGLPRRESPFAEVLSGWMGRRSFTVSPDTEGIDFDLIFRATILMDNIETCLESMKGGHDLQDFLSEFTKGIEDAIHRHSDDSDLRSAETTTLDAACHNSSAASYFNIRTDVASAWEIDELNPAINLLLSVLFNHIKIMCINSNLIFNQQCRQRQQVLQQQQQLQKLHLQQQQCLQILQRQQQLLHPHQLLQQQHQNLLQIFQQQSQMAGLQQSHLLLEQRHPPTTVRGPRKRDACELILECCSRMHYRQVRRRLGESPIRAVFGGDSDGGINNSSEDEQQTQFRHLQRCVEIATQRYPNDKDTDVAHPTIVQLCRISSWGNAALLNCFLGRMSLRGSDVCNLLCSAVSSGNITVVKVLLDRFRDTLLKIPEQFEEVLHRMNTNGMSRIASVWRQSVTWM